MVSAFDVAEKNLAELIDWYNNNVTEAGRNEATTRLHLIDRLLFECLGWEREDCISEERLNGQITDYSFRCPACLFILEAKNEGTYFELPIGKQGIIYNIKYFKRYFKDVGEAIEQAIEYCQSRGAPYGAVCNGHQLIAFLGSRTDGHPPIEGKALVFDSLQSIQENFLFIWQNLSKQGITSRRLYFELIEPLAVPVPNKMSATINGYPGYKRRNTLQTDLRILAEIFIEGLSRIEEKEEGLRFLENCYCKSGALSQYAMVSKEILQTRYSALFESETEGPSLESATTKKGLNPELLAQSLSKTPILLIGDVGVGKSIFIQHLYQVEASDVFNNAIALYFDFGSNPSLETDLEKFVHDEIERQLIEKYDIDIYTDNFVRGVLHSELQRFKRSIHGPRLETDPDLFRDKELEFIEEKIRRKDEYLNRCLTHIERGHRKQIIIFLDNIDQRHYSFQERTFLIGQTMANNWPITVFISIRPETFYKSRSYGTLSAYHPRAFTISPPRVDEVVVKRLNYGISLLERGAPEGIFGQISVQLVSLTDYLKVLVDSFQTTRYVIEFLDNMCGGNIRLALDFVGVFIGSGHVDTLKILDIYKSTGRYTVPLHEFLRAVIYGEHEYYSSATSAIVNLFDISSPNGSEHFLSPILLAQLGRWAQQHSNSGFISTSEIYEYMQSIGFSPVQISWAIDRLNRKKLIEPPVRSDIDSPVDTTLYYRLTTVGGYYVGRLISQFTYIDAMIVDTPILNPDMRSQIQDVLNISDRLARSRLFIEYLQSQWVSLEGQELVFDWPRVKGSMERNIEYVEGKISPKEDILEPPIEF